MRVNGFRGEKIAVFLACLNWLTDKLCRQEKTAVDGLKPAELKLAGPDVLFIGYTTTAAAVYQGVYVPCTYYIKHLEAVFASINL